MKYGSLSLLCLLFLGCNNSSVVDLVIEEFEKENPGFSVIDAYVGEGDADNAYVHVKYEDPGKKKINEAIYLHQKTKDKETLKIVSK